MCGIAGEFAYADGSGVSLKFLDRSRQALANRGPDGSGIWLSSDNRVGFAHTRLSILDLSNDAAQPMRSADGRYTLVFNGEIYNFQELGQRLIDHGRPLVSTGDSEVLLAMYAEHGLSMFDFLRGMYAFAIWDDVAQELVIGRDPLGIKPLYYSDNGSRLCFSSQVKALLVRSDIDSSPEPAGHVGFFLWGSVPEPFTLCKGIRALPAGHWLRVRREDRPVVQPFAQPQAAMAEPFPDNIPATRQEMRERLHSMLHESIDYHLRSDVPVCVFQSAGLDSSVVTELSSEIHSHPVHTLTLGFEESRGTDADEVPLASFVSKECGVEHTCRYIDRHVFLEHIERLFTGMDQPTVDGVNTYFVSLLAKEAGYKVALSGLGGDELFGGYPSFQQVPRMARTLKRVPFGKELGRGLRAISAGALRHFTSPKYAGLLEYGTDVPGSYLLRRSLFMPWELPDILDPDLVREGWRQLATFDHMNQLLSPVQGVQPDALRDFLQVSALETTLYMRNQLLRDADWAGMANSVEIRVPFVDMSLIRQMAPLRCSPYLPRKEDMAACLSPRIHEALAHRPKTGFAVPVNQWIEDQISRERGLRGWARYIYRRFTDSSGSRKIHQETLSGFQVA